MSKKKSGEETKLVCRIHTRVTAEKYRALSDLLTKCRSIHSHSELLRHILDNRVIVIKTRDASVDMVMEELAGIRKELQAIGANINQVVRHFHIEDLPESRMLKALEIVRLCQQTDLKVSEIFSIISKLSEKWLPG